MAALLHTLLARIRGFLRPSDVDAEIEQELEAHLAIAEDDKVRSGLTRAEARRMARLELGGVAQLREASREARGLPRLDTFWLDLKLGVRMLRKTWGLTLIGGLALTTAISITVGLFNVYQAITGASLPLDEGDRVVSLMVWDAADQTTRGVALSDFERWKPSLRSVVNLGAFRTVERNLAVGNRRVELVSVAEITASGFDVARVPPLLGRPIRSEDERLGAEPVVVIGHDVWASVFSSDREVTGQVVRIDEVPHTVIGVMPDTFAFPVNHHYWTPLRTTMQASQQSPEPTVIAFGRLAPGVALPAADAEMRTIGLLRTTNQDDDRQARAMSYVGGISGTGGALGARQWFLFVTAGLLLLPPCANIAILIYARTVTRQAEFAARHALGGSRARIVGQLSLEALLLVAGATVASLVIVSRVGKHLQADVRLPNGNPFWLDLSSIQPETLLFAVIVAALAAGIVGLVPALQAVGRLTDVAALGGRSTLKLGAAWTGLVALQVALSIAVIPVAGELAWGIIRPAVVGPGVAAEQFLTARLTFGQAQNPNPAEPGDAARFERLHAQFTSRLEALPEVAILTRSAVAPGREPRLEIEVEGGSASQHAPARVNAVDPSFFETFDMGVVAGRIFDGTPGGTDQVVVNRALARHIAGDGSPVGWRLRDSPTGARSRESGWTRGDSPAGDGPWQEIVGVVDDLQASSGHPTVYRPLPENQHPFSLSVRLTTGRPQMAQRLRDLGAEINADLHVSDVRSLADLYNDSIRGVYLAGLMLGSAALSVLLLSAAGIYALMSFTVARRRREIAIRSALGARSTRLLVGILGRAARQIGIGAMAGVLLALWLGSYLPIEAIGGARVPGLIPAAAVTMTIVGLLAAAGPARRALRLDPTEALRDN
jgi:predicted permease